MGDFGAIRDKWVCPNDRELSLRAKLKTGWSVKTNSINSFNKPAALSDAEQEAILGVIKRAENIEKVEQERVGRLVDRLDNMKKNAMGNGSTQCVLCAEEFGILGQSQLCKDCEKAVCSKCGIETVSAHKEPLFLCRICAETRETWKKSGAWFYRGLPKYILPSRRTEPSRYSSAPSTPLRGQEPLRSTLQTKGRSGSEYTDSSDEEFRSSRFTKRGTVRKQVESGDNAECAAVNIQPLEVSPTHLYSPESPQHRDPEQILAPGYEDYKRREEWYKVRSQVPEDYPERTYRPMKKEPPRHRSLSANKNEEHFDDKTTAEETSKKRNLFYKKKKHKKHN